jgi:4-hydroxy-tetrahydrodipicolinate synthase
MTAMVTPFDADGWIDEEATRRLVDYLLASGSDGLVVCGTTGEAPTLSLDEKRLMFELVKDAAAGRGAIVAGTGTNDTRDAVELSRIAADVGVDGLLVVTPYYNKPSQEGLYQHFRAVAEATALPNMPYNVPGRTSVNLTADTCLRLAHDVPNVVAVKEASGNMMQITDIVAGAPEGFVVYSGEDGLVLPMLALGAYGVVSVTSHLVGQSMKAMIAAFLTGDHAEAARLHARMLPIVRACFQATTPSPVPLKAALDMLAVPVGPPRLPLVEADAREREIVAEALRTYGLLA